MTEEPQEPTEATEAVAPEEPQEPTGPEPDPDAEPVEPIEPDEEPTEPTEPSEPREPSASFSEQELDKIGKQLDGARRTLENRIRVILGDDLGGLVPCPTCMDGTPGYIFPPDVAPLTEEQRDRMLQILGLDEWNEMPSAEWARQCETCLGYGKVKTGSHVGGRETAECEDCNGAGWNNTRQRAVSVPLPFNPDEPAGQVVTPEPVDPDPRVASLQRDGFTVIPPYRPPVGS